MKKIPPHLRNPQNQTLPERRCFKFPLGCPRRAVVLITITSESRTIRLQACKKHNPDARAIVFEKIQNLKSFQVSALPRENWKEGRE